MNTNPSIVQVVSPATRMARTLGAWLFTAGRVLVPVALLVFLAACDSKHH